MMRFSTAKRNSVAALILAAAAFTLYFSTLHYGFVWDDLGQVEENVWIRSIKYIPEIFAKNVWGFVDLKTNYYRPGMHLGYMLAYHLFGPGPFGFHLLNVIFNAAVSVMVFLLALEIFEISGTSSGRVFGISFLSALLFTAHPIHTESVAWVASFPDLSFSLFYLMSLYFFVLWRKKKLKEGIYLSCLFFVFSFLCKETALSLPLAIAAYDIAFPAQAPQSGSFRKMSRLKVLLPYLALTVAYFAIRLKVAGLTRTGKSDFHLTNFQFLLNAIVNFSMYLGQLLYPFKLNAFHVFHPVHSLLEWKSITSIAALLAFISGLFWSYKRNRTVFFGLLMILVPLLPALYLPALQPESTYAERYLYLPSAGFAFIFSGFLFIGRPKRIRLAFLAFAALLIIAYAVKTVKRNPVWRNESSLWTDTLRKSPDGWVPQNQLGILLKSKGQYALAADHFMTAIKLAPNTPDPVINLGYTLMDMGKLDEAANQFKEVLQTEPLLGDAHVGLGAVYAIKGEAGNAEAEFQTAITLNPRFFEAYRDLGLLYYEKHLYGPALKEFSLALSIDPYSSKTLRYMGLAYEAQGSLDIAIRQYELAAKADPSDVNNYDVLGDIFLKKGMRDKAAENFRAALKLDPANRKAQTGLKALGGQATIPPY